MSRRITVRAVVLPALFLMVSTGGAQTVPTVPTPSFDCKKATTPTEKAICASGELGQLDTQISQQFKKVRTLASLYLRRTLLDEQMGWLKERNKCGRDEACLRTSMQKRAAGLVSFTDEYEHPREERYGPFLFRYVRSKHWDGIGPILVSGPPGVRTTRLAEHLQSQIEVDGCDGDESKSAARSATKVLFADDRLVSLGMSTHLDCVGAMRIFYDSTVVTYDLSTGKRLDFAEAFTEGLTGEELLDLAIKHDRGFEKPAQVDCLEMFAEWTTSEPRFAVVGEGIVFSPFFPQAMLHCDRTTTTIPFKALAPFILKSGPLASYLRQ